MLVDSAAYLQRRRVSRRQQSRGRCPTQFVGVRGDPHKGGSMLRGSFKECNVSHVESMDMNPWGAAELAN